jgi:ribA/ribD-fused uncharacterized protein
MTGPYVTRELPPTDDEKWVTRYEGYFEFLSNFHPCMTMYLGEAYPTVEHAYQAAKFPDPKIRTVVRGLPRPADAKHYARDNKRLQDPDFHERKVNVMFALNWQKFNKQPFRTQLANTGKVLLVEGNEWGDKFWGVCQGEGLNHLGRLQMKLRLMAHFEDAYRGRTEFDPDYGVYIDQKVQEAWSLFRAGFRCGHEIDYRTILV